MQSMVKDKGGKTALIRLIRRSELYREWVKAVHLRDRCTCQQCGARNGRKRVIEAHHLVELSTLVTLHNITSVEQARECVALWSADNGLTLCHSCHEKTESYPVNFRKPVKKKRKKA
ncbi:HNH endonuclease [Spirosoma validum]|uniref:HNH endonuclease n=1 Tax=Spirosoma validum TaxID=2771355 RepID=UPI00374225B2